MLQRLKSKKNLKKNLTKNKWGLEKNTILENAGRIMGVVAKLEWICIKSTDYGTSKMSNYDQMWGKCCWRNCQQAVDFALIYKNIGLKSWELIANDRSPPIEMYQTLLGNFLYSLKRKYIFMLEVLLFTANCGMKWTISTKTETMNRSWRKWILANIDPKIQYICF